MGNFDPLVNSETMASLLFCLHTRYYHSARVKIELWPGARAMAFLQFFDLIGNLGEAGVDLPQRYMTVENHEQKRKKCPDSEQSNGDCCQKHRFSVSGGHLHMPPIQFGPGQRRLRLRP